jgi:hypothetical protein
MHIYVNNRLEGNASMTLEAIMALLEKSAGEREFPRTPA